ESKKPEVRVESTFSHPEIEHDVKVRLAEWIHDIRTCMLCTLTPEGHIASAPMTTLEIDADGNIWFFVGIASESTEEIEREENVNLVYASPRDYRYASVTGIGTIVFDREKAERLWNDSYRAWFPRGLEDPNLALLRVKPLSAELWGTPMSRTLRAYGLIRALFTAEPFNVGTDHEKVKLN